MKASLIALLQQAHPLITSQLDISHCSSHGEPKLEEPRCHNCHQLSACSWRYGSADENALRYSDTIQLTRDFFLALLLIQQYCDSHAFSPNQQKLAIQWLKHAETLKTELVEDEVVAS